MLLTDSTPVDDITEETRCVLLIPVGRLGKKKKVAEGVVFPPGSCKEYEAHEIPPDCAEVNIGWVAPEHEEWELDYPGHNGVNTLGAALCYNLVWPKVDIMLKKTAADPTTPPDPYGGSSDGGDSDGNDPPPGSSTPPAKDPAPPKDPTPANEPAPKEPAPEETKEPTPQEPAPEKPKEPTPQEPAHEGQPIFEEAIGENTVPDPEERIGNETPIYTKGLQWTTPQAPGKQKGAGPSKCPPPPKKPTFDEEEVVADKYPSPKRPPVIDVRSERYAPLKQRVLATSFRNCS